MPPCAAACGPCSPRTTDEDRLAAPGGRRRQFRPEPEALAGRYRARFRLLCRLGRGGMGAVYLGEREHSNFRRRVRRWTDCSTAWTNPTCPRPAAARTAPARAPRAPEHRASDRRRRTQQERHAVRGHGIRRWLFLARLRRRAGILGLIRACNCSCNCSMRSPTPTAT